MGYDLRSYFIGLHEGPEQRVHHKPGHALHHRHVPRDLRVGQARVHGYYGDVAL